MFNALLIAFAVIVFEAIYATVMKKSAPRWIRIVCAVAVLAVTVYALTMLIYEMVGPHVVFDVSKVAVRFLCSLAALSVVACCVFLLVRKDTVSAEARKSIVIFFCAFMVLACAMILAFAFEIWNNIQFRWIGEADLAAFLSTLLAETLTVVAALAYIAVALKRVSSVKRNSNYTPLQEEGEYEALLAKSSTVPQAYQV
jgi:hypothetical protein